MQCKLNRIIFKKVPANWYNFYFFGRECANYINELEALINKENGHILTWMLLCNLYLSREPACRQAGAGITFANWRLIQISKSGYIDLRLFISPCFPSTSSPTLSGHPGLFHHLNYQDCRSRSFALQGLNLFLQY